MSDAQVIIVGAGPVGLGAALELARFGVRSVLLEKHESTSWHPKTRNFNTRTMEIARGWGAPVYKRLRSIDTPPGWKSPIRFLRTATGEQLGVIESKGFEGPGPDVSPAEPAMTSQELIEEILFDAVRATGLVDVRFSTEVTKLIAGGDAVDQHAAVAVRSRGSGAEETLTAPALIAVSACSVVNTVPAPRRISGKRERIRAMASAAAAVRNVTSAQGRPPSSSASASGNASSSFGRLTTGMIPIPRARSTMFIEDPNKE